MLTSPPPVSEKALRAYVIYVASIPVASGSLATTLCAAERPRAADPRAWPSSPRRIRFGCMLGAPCKAVSQSQGIGLVVSLSHWLAVFPGLPKSLVSLLTTPGR